ncbi:hypothetical protein FRC10_000546 [Ceratobasidium sp. 414]|nr:hypothetical protein FRC10_000546 [Ceratobasidium sp. 414]
MSEKTVTCEPARCSQAIQLKNVLVRPSEPLSAEPSSSLRPDPGRQASNPSKRKQTLLALLSELTDLKDEETFEREPGPISADATQDVNSREGVATFRAFDGYARGLDRQLQSFANSVRQLGSSVGLMNATYHLRGALIQIEYFFRENAADLFTEIRRGSTETARANAKQNEDSENDSDITRKIRRVRDKDRIHTGMRPQVKPVADFEQFPVEMEKLSKQIEVFVDRLNDIPEFTDELVNATCLSFASDLRGQLKTIAVQRYINDLSVDIGMHMESVRDALSTFIEVGVPTIRHAQNHTANGLQYLSTVATFFSGVTATTIQYSFNVIGNTRADLVNALWIISLIFSIASAINSQLAYHCKCYGPASVEVVQVFRGRACCDVSLPSQLRALVGNDMDQTIASVLPHFSLQLAVSPFISPALVFTYSSGQSPVVSALVTAFTILLNSNSVSVGLWFASERWTFSRTRGQRWLFDILNDFQAKVNKYLGITWIIRRWPKDARTRLMSWIRVQIHNIRLALQNMYSCCGRRRRPVDEEKDHASDYPGAVYPRPGDFDAGSITETVMSGPASPGRTSEQRTLPVSGSVLSVSTHNGVGSVAGQSSGSPSLAQALLRAAPGTGLSGLSQTPEGEERPKPLRLKLLVEKVIAVNKMSANRAKLAARARAESDLVTGGRRESNDNYGSTSYAHKARIRDLKPGLACLQISQFLNEHLALVKHMQFSPQGDFLATCSWDRTAIIWRITETNVELYLKLYHPVSTGGFVNQVAWSPDGSKLLTRTQKGLKLWDAATGNGHKAIGRPRPIQSAAWMPEGQGILSVEYKLQRRGDVQPVTDTCLVHLDSNGTVINSHTLPRIQIWDTAIMADGVRVVAVGTLLRSVDNLRPTKSRAEKRLLVYNMKTREVEHHVPLLQDVRNVTLSCHTQKSTYALISYENKAPPQMWRIDMKTGVKPGEPVARLILVHFDFAGQSYFGGPNDSFVCCSSKSGEIFIWDRTSATLLHTLRPEDSEVIKNFACNGKAAPGFMLVTGALDGALRIWSSGVPNGLGIPDRRMTSSPELQSEGTSTPRRGASGGTS